jgi:hypothetical protein
MNTIEMLLAAIASLKGIESIASGKGKLQRTKKDRLQAVAFLARTQAHDLTIQLQALAKETAQAVGECEAMHADKR